MKKAFLNDRTGRTATGKRPLEKEEWLKNKRASIHFLRQNNRFLLGAFQDADSVGSMLSLALYLKQLGKSPTLVLPNEIKNNLSFLKSIILHNDIQVFTQEKEIAELNIQFDGMIFCDTATPHLLPYHARYQDFLLQNGRKVLEIDHHFGGDSSSISDTGIHLHKEANSSTEIVAELLQGYHREYPDTPDPFSFRNILLSLLTGLLTDTQGGENPFDLGSYTDWSLFLESRLKKTTHSMTPEFDNSESRFISAQCIMEFLDRLTQDQSDLIAHLKKKIVKVQSVGFLNLLNSTYDGLPTSLKVYDSYFSIRPYLAQNVQEEMGSIGLICYNEESSVESDCIFLKIRRTSHWDYDLRELSSLIGSVFGADRLLGGGGHANAVTFRLRPLDETLLIKKIHLLISALNTLKTQDPLRVN